MLQALRADAGLGPLPPGALDQDARELAMMLHGCAVFALIRQEVYRRELHLDRAALVRMQSASGCPAPWSSCGG